MKQYLDMLRLILDEGKDRGDRTGVGTRGIFGHQARFDLGEGFPLLTTKKMFYKGIIHELLWFLSGDTNVNYLQEKGVKIWDEWATKEKCELFGRQEGDLGPIYGHQWRNYGATLKEDGTYKKDGVDQIAGVLEQIINNPNSRRHIVTGWNPQEADKVALPPCHTLFQFHVEEDRLNCQLYQRSADVFLGVPFNIASYSLLTMMVAQVTGLKPGQFVHTFGDLHLYKNHFEQAELQLSRDPKPLPIMEINSSVKKIDGFKYEDFELREYNPHPKIKAPIAI